MQKRLLPAPTKGSAIENEKEKASASRYDRQSACHDVVGVKELVE